MCCAYVCDVYIHIYMHRVCAVSVCMVCVQCDMWRRMFPLPSLSHTCSRPYPGRLHSPVGFLLDKKLPSDQKGVWEAITSILHWLPPLWPVYIGTWGAQPAQNQSSLHWVLTLISFFLYKCSWKWFQSVFRKSVETFRQHYWCLMKFLLLFWPCLHWNAEIVWCVCGGGKLLS